MSQLVEAFGLGIAAILTNACMLPLYPGLIAFMAGTANSERSRRATGWLGLLVLLGVLSMMTLIGLLVYGLHQTFGAVLPLLLPLVYGLVIVFGVLLLLDRNPFARLSTAQAPILSNPFAVAYVYGLLLGPMTLPCTGPLITSAFALGAGNFRSLADGLLYFLAFGFGFGLPLILLPLITLPVQRRFVGWLTRHHRLLNRASGILLIAVGLFGFLTELLPNYLPEITITPEMWAIYWLAVVVIIAALVVFTLRRRLEASG